MTRQHVVRSRRRAVPSPVPGLPAWELVNRLHQGAREAWPRWAGVYGPLEGRWAPQNTARTPSRKIELLLSVVLSLLLEQIGEEFGVGWTLDLECDDQGNPVRMIVSGGGPVLTVPIKVTEKLITVAGYDIALRSRDCGERLLDRLLDGIVAALIATPRAA